MQSAPTREELRIRARKMRNDLASRAVDAERERCIPQATIDAFVENGFFRTLVPRRSGGFELPLDALLDVSVEVGEVCGSSAWVLSLLAIHNWLAALYGEETREELFGDRGFVLAPACFAPGGSLERREGGFVLRGRWAFASGAAHAQWAFVSATRAAGSAGEAQILCVAIPRDDFVVADTWHTAGMRGTGSHDLVVEEAFIPERRTLDFRNLVEGRAAAADAPPLYRQPLVPVLAQVAAAPALGIARGARAAFRDALQERVRLDGSRSVESAPTQVRFAESSLEIDSAGLMLEAARRELAGLGAEGGSSGEGQRLSIWMKACFATTLCVRAVDRLMAAAGAHAQFLSSTLQQKQRDLHTLGSHFVFDFDTTAQAYARNQLGLSSRHPLA